MFLTNSWQDLPFPSSTLNGPGFVFLFITSSFGKVSLHQCLFERFVSFHQGHRYAKAIRYQLVLDFCIGACREAKIVKANGETQNTTQSFGGMLDDTRFPSKCTAAIKTLHKTLRLNFPVFVQGRQGHVPGGSSVLRGNTAQSDVRLQPEEYI
jgi:hypothetical protein